MNLECVVARTCVLIYALEILLPVAIHPLLICWYYRQHANAIRYFQDIEETSHEIPEKL